MADAARHAAAPDGSPRAGVTITRWPIAAAWNVQGNPSRVPFTEAVREAFGLGLPLRPNTLAVAGPLAAYWLGPSSWLLVAAGASRLTEFAAKRDLLNARGGALFDLAASRVAWTVSGPRAEAVLASGCPLDLHPRAFPSGSCAQSVLWHSGVLLARHDASPAFTILLPRSFADDAWHALCESAAQWGCEIVPAPAS